MYDDTIDFFAALAEKKAQSSKHSPLAFWIGGLMAGAYVGIGVILIFTVGAGLDPAYRQLIMGMSFGIALTLVVFAGAELFTGHTMYMMFGWLKRVTSLGDLGRVWLYAWVFNLLGAFFLGVIYSCGGGAVLTGADALLIKVAEHKMNSPPVELFARAILANWLVCLSLWACARSSNDVARCIFIFWCLFAFIASGFEHSVANMTLFSIALLAEHPDTVTVYGMFYNLFWVTLGNIAAGSVLMGLGYWFACSHTLPMGKSDHIDSKLY